MFTVYGMPGHLIRRLHQISISVFAARMRQLGVDLTAPQFAALSVLHEHDGIDQATLAGLIAHDRATMGGVIERLSTKGLVARRVSEQDRRAKLLSLTPKGQDLLAMLLPEVTQLQADILSGLDEAEQSEFLRLAKKLASSGNSLSRAPLLPAKAARPKD